MAEYPIILGVYCYQEHSNHGLGGTVKRDQVYTYNYVRNISEDRFEVQPLNNRQIPSGIRSFVDRLEFLLHYQPEPQYYYYNSPPEMDSLLYKVDQNKKDFDRNNLNEAEKKLIQALMIDESNINLDNDPEYLSSGNQDYVKLKKVLEMLKCCEENFNFEQRQRFNHFGISLRKNGYYDESINYHQKSFEIDEQDEHVYFNLARVYFEKGSIDSCIDYLQKALDLNPQFEEARKFIRYCRK